MEPNDRDGVSCADRGYVGFVWLCVPGQLQVRVPGVVLVPGLVRLVFFSGRAAVSQEIPRSLVMPPRVGRGYLVLKGQEFGC